MKDINILEQQSFLRFCDNNIESSVGKYDCKSPLMIQGTTTNPFAILDSGANSTFFVIDNS